MGESSYSPGLPVVLEDLEVEEDDEGEGQGDGGDEPVPAKAEERSKSSWWDWHKSNQQKKTVKQSTTVSIDCS